MYVAISMSPAYICSLVQLEKYCTGREGIADEWEDEDVSSTTGISDYEKQRQKRIKINQRVLKAIFEEVNPYVSNYIFIVSFMYNIILILQHPTTDNRDSTNSKITKTAKV